MPKRLLRPKAEGKHLEPGAGPGKILSSLSRQPGPQTVCVKGLPQAASDFLKLEPSYQEALMRHHGQ